MFYHFYFMCLEASNINPVFDYCSNKTYDIYYYYVKRIY